MTEETETLFLLWAARETGVLDALLSDADTPAEVADRTDVTERAARLTVEALADEGFFTPVDGAYEPTNRALGFLAASDLRSVGSIPAALDDLEALQALPATMRGADPAPTSDADASKDAGLPTDAAPPAESEKRKRNRLGRVEATDAATVRASVTVAQHAAPDAECVVDLGGAPGTYAREFARRGYDVTLVDEQSRLDASAPLLEREAVETVAWDLSSLSVLASGSESVSGPGPPTLPVDGVDCAFVPMRTHEYDAETNRRLVAAAADALAPGGWLVVVDHLRGRSRDATATTVTRLALGAGEAHGQSAYREWFEAAGLRAVQVRDVPGTNRQTVVGKARDS